MQEQESIGHNPFEVERAERDAAIETMEHFLYIIQDQGSYYPGQNEEVDAEVNNMRQAIRNVSEQYKKLNNTMLRARGLPEIA
jgi:hypothetical protein